MTPLTPEDKFSILSEYRLLRKDLEELDKQMASFTAQVKEWMASTKEYRQSLCDKVENILIRLNGLPCDKRSGIYSSILNQLKIIWAFITAIVLSFITSFFNHVK